MKRIARNKNLYRLYVAKWVQNEVPISEKHLRKLEGNMDCQKLDEPFVQTLVSRALNKHFSTIENDGDFCGYNVASSEHKKPGNTFFMHTSLMSMR